MVCLAATCPTASFSRLVPCGPQSLLSYHATWHMTIMIKSTSCQTQTKAPHPAPPKAIPWQPTSHPQLTQPSPIWNTHRSTPWGGGMRLTGFHFNLIGGLGGRGVYMVDKTVMNTWVPCLGSMACAHVHACTCASNSQDSSNPAQAKDIPHQTKVILSIPKPPSQP